jgi:multiubiquitin
MSVEKGETQGTEGLRFQIQIDRVHYTVTQARMTGAELRRVPASPIGPDRDLFQVVPGGPDRKIEDADVVEIKSGLRFFTAPALINPGRGTAESPR